MSNIRKNNKNRIISIKMETLLEFRRRLLVWYENNGRNFPWRKKSVSKYKLIISEVLLQRTRAVTVANFFNIFIKKYPSWKKLAKAKKSEIGEIIRPIGLWKRRASTLKQLAIFMSNRNGRFPRTRDEIEAMPGVGQYITNAILLQCHGEAQPLLDVNMARVLERVFGPRKLADIRYDSYLQGLSLKVVQCKESKEMNWAILDLAASKCIPRRPRCKTCPLESMCLRVRKDTRSNKRERG
jgi:A/G-specific adenine glycosylase